MPLCPDAHTQRHLFRERLPLLDEGSPEAIAAWARSLAAEGKALPEALLRERLWLRDDIAQIPALEALGLAAGPSDALLAVACLAGDGAAQRACAKLAALEAAGVDLGAARDEFDGTLMHAAAETFSPTLMAFLDSRGLDIHALAIAAGCTPFGVVFERACRDEVLHGASDPLADAAPAELAWLLSIAEADRLPPPEDPAFKPFAPLLAAFPLSAGDWGPERAAAERLRGALFAWRDAAALRQGLGEGASPEPGTRAPRARL